MPKEIIDGCFRVEEKKKTEQIMEVFKNYAVYDKTDEMRRGLYQREYTALCEWKKREGEEK